MEIKTLVDRARELLQIGGHASLATHSLKHPGFPFVSVAPYALAEDGSPIFFFSSMATHSRNLKANPKATLLVAQSTGENPLAASRVSVIGEVFATSDDEVAEFRKRYVARNPESVQWLDFNDFSFYRLNIVDIYLVAGFGAMGWITRDDYFG